jgi:PAS domain S-box-containing protein
MDETDKRIAGLRFNRHGADISVFGGFFSELLTRHYMEEKKSKTLVLNEDRDKLDLLNDLRESEKRYAFLLQTANEMAVLGSVDEIYTYTARKINQQLNYKSIVAIVEFNHKANLWKMQHLEGVSENLKELTRLFGFDLRKAEGEISTKYHEKILNGRLVEMDFDLPGLFNNKVRNAVGQAVRQIFSIEKMYCIAFGLQRNLFGNITFITNKKTGSIDADMLEAFVIQAGNFANRLMAEQELKSQYKLLETAGKTAKFGGWSIDLETSLVSWSDAVADIHEMPRGYAPKVSEGISFYAPEWQETIKRVFTDCAERGMPYDEELEIISASGVRKWVRTTGEAITNEKGRIIELQGAFQDISSLKINEDKLKKHQQLINKIFEKLPIGIAVNLVKPEVRFEMMNDNFAKIYGASRESLEKPDAFWEVVYEDETFKKEIKDRVLSDLDSGDPERREWHDVPLTKNGEIVRYISAHTIPIEDSDAVISTVMDVTARKLGELELIKAKEKAQESDRLKSAFLANMSHEIRTPMNAILGFSELLKNPQLTGDQKGRFVNTIEKSGQRMLNLINDIVNISKIESGLMEVSESAVNVHEVMHYIFDIFKPEFARQKPGIDFQLKIPSEEFTVTTDKEKLQSVLINLVSNAAKFTQAGFVEFGFRREDGVLSFFVNDSGIGVPKDMQERVFERFFQVDVSYGRGHEGSGLGLSIAKAFVELLGGEITLESEQGKGSAFSFSLPIQPALASKPAREDIQSGQPSNRAGEKHAILVVEDDQASFDVIQFMLEEMNVEILHAVSGEEGIAMFRERPGIELILMDIKMPGIDGLEATRRIRVFDPKVPIIAQTAHALSGDREIALEAGCNDYISKPIKREALLKSIGQFI